MSGGSWDYAYNRFNEVADSLETEKDPLRVALGKRVRLIAKAMHDIEWVDSCDYSNGAELPAIKAALEGSSWKAEAILTVNMRAIEIIRQLQELGVSDE